MDKANIYTYHWDVPNQRWNIFDPDNNYITFRILIGDARQYCEEQNDKLHAEERNKYAIQE